MRRLFTIGLMILTAFAVGCTTHSSGGGGTGGGAAPGNGQQENGGGQAGGGQRTRTTPWQCAVQFENGVIACGTYTSAASDEDLQQHCLNIPGQLVNQCPVNNFILTCLIRVEGADIRFRMAGTQAQRNEMVQLCQQNNGQVQR